MTSELRRVGPWELLDELGHGGNSTVYRARVAAQGELLALKVLDTHKIQSERYARFVHEVRVLEDLRDFPGVLPLRDAELPERPSRRSPAWLAMPIATPLDQALSGASVENVVAAIRSIAETLSRLKKEHGIGHRDIKPGNLFEIDSQYLVGDFGLVAVPDAEPLATDARPMGSRHYMPYEMFTKPSTADPYAVDVYCLAKTLWVLLTEQNYPLEGNQAAGSRHFSLVDQRPHPGAVALDGLIDRMTLLDPTSRPSMEQVARDLGAWMELAPGTRQEIDVSDLVTRFRSAAADELDAQDEHTRQIQGAASAIELVSDLTRRYDNAIGELKAPRALYRVPADRETDATLRVVFGASGSLVTRWASTSLIGVSEAPASVVLRIARAIEVYSSGTLYLMLRVEVKLDQVVAPHLYYWQLPLTEAPVGSIECQQLIEKSIEAMTQPVKDALVRFVAALEER